MVPEVVHEAVLWQKLIPTQMMSDHQTDRRRHRETFQYHKSFDLVHLQENLGFWNRFVMVCVCLCTGGIGGRGSSCWCLITRTHDWQLQLDMDCGKAEAVSTTDWNL